MSKLVVLSGVPGSGKSYFSKLLRKHKKAHVYIISSDALRDIVTGNQRNISEDELMWKMYYELAAVYSQDKNGIVVLDATNRSRKYRIECVRELKTHFDEADLVIFDIPKEIVMKQNLEREFPVPEFVLEEYFREFEPPTKEDYEFLKKQDFKTSYIMEPAGIIYDTLNSKEEKKRLLEDRVKFVDMQFDVGLNKINEYINNSEIIICDRGIIDTFIWYDMYYKMGLLSDSEYDQKISKSQILKNFINYFYVLYSDSFESMRRDYNCTLSLEPRSTINDYFISNYNEFIDTTTYEIMDASIELSNDIMDNVKKLYLNK